MKQLFKCETCSKEFFAYAYQRLRRFCSKNCINNRGGNNPAFKRGWRKESNGYIYEQNPGHPLADKKCRVLQHRRIVYDFLGFIPDGFSIHHINGNKTDNRIENLSFIKQSDHIMEHDPLFSRYGKRTKFSKKPSKPISVISYLSSLDISS